jgi:hypothetical protein
MVTAYEVIRHTPHVLGIGCPKVRNDAFRYTDPFSAKGAHVRQALAAITVIGFTVIILIYPLIAQTKDQNAMTASPATSPSPNWMDTAKSKAESELVQKYGEGQRTRIQRGLKQVGEFWRAEDGDQTAFAQFVTANFAGDQATLDAVFTRSERLLEQLYGHLHEINREFRNQADLDVGPMLPLDEITAGYDPTAHVIDDFFQNKFAFVVLLNFPLTTLEERLTQGDNWSRRQWAEVRLAQFFSKRVPASVNQAIAAAGAQSDSYIAQYNIWMHHLVDDKGNRLFPPKLRLLSHWNLRDEIKADYSDAQNGLPKQRAIMQVMERIVTQTIPESAIDNPQVDWNPWTNEVKPSSEKDYETAPHAKTAASNTPEPDTRYLRLLNDYKAVRLADPYSPTAPTFIARRFDENREIPEPRVRQMLEQIVSSPVVPKVAALIQKRLGRPLEPFDIWYNGFRQRGQYTEAQLDEIVAKKYPTAEAYKADIPRLLENFGFTKETAERVANNIVVDPARGSGHAMGAGMKSEKAHLRTRVEKTGMNYKGYNIAIHEMGHNVEQTFSMNDIDYFTLNGVPNTAFTEALAFVFQGHDLEQLGLAKPDAQSDALKTLNDFWGTYEIAGVALVDMGVWHWMYDHPNATPAELKQATLGIAKDVWNKYYAPVFHKRDVMLLGIYSHMIDSFLYLPDYPIGHMIAFQIEEKIPNMHSVGPQFERMAKYGSMTPDNWMKHATGAPVGPDALLNATERAVSQVQ